MTSSGDAKVSGKSIRFNLKLLFNLLKKWSGLTVIIIALLSGYSAYYFASEHGFTPTEITITIVGNIAVMASLKVTVLIITYPFFNKLAFEGSLFILALLTALLLVIAIGSGFILVASRIDTFRTAELIWLLPLVFAIFSIYFFAAFHLFHWMFKRDYGDRLR